MLKFVEKIKFKFLKNKNRTSIDNDEETFKFTTKDGEIVSKKLGISFDTVKYTVEDFTFGMNIELEHGSSNPKTNLTNNDPLLSGKIALAHLNEFPDYYDRLKKWKQLLVSIGTVKIKLDNNKKHKKNGPCK
ncbi:MAG: DUF5661 family protein [Sarcina sp.]